MRLFPENSLCRNGSLYSLSKLLHCMGNYSSPPAFFPPSFYFFFFINVTTYTPYFPKELPEESELCSDSLNINSTDKAVTSAGTNSTPGACRKRVNKEPVEPLLLGNHGITEWFGL